MVRSELSFTMMVSIMLYKLTDIAGWKLLKEAPETSRMSTYGWKQAVSFHYHPVGSIKIRDKYKIKDKYVGYI